MAHPNESAAEDTSWKDGRLVVRRAEIRDSDVARMNVPLTRARRFALSTIVYEMIEAKRREDEERLRAELHRYQLLPPD